MNNKIKALTRKVYKERAILKQLQSTRLGSVDMSIKSIKLGYRGIIYTTTDNKKGFLPESQYKITSPKQQAISILMENELWNSEYKLQLERGRAGLPKTKSTQLRDIDVISARTGIELIAGEDVDAFNEWLDGDDGSLGDRKNSYYHEFGADDSFSPTQISRYVKWRGYNSVTDFLEAVGESSGDA